MSVIIAALQKDLLALEHECKKKYPDIKTSSESLRVFLSGIEQSESEDISSVLLSNQELFKPFFLAFESKNTKLIGISIVSIYRLVSLNIISNVFCVS